MKFPSLIKALIDRCFLRRHSLTETPEEMAKRLLLAHLTPRQQWELRVFGRFTIRGNVTGFEYRVHPMRSFGVTRVHDGTWLCAIPHDSLRMPIGDIMLTLKLTIENDEQEFIRAARAGYERLSPVPAPHTSSDSTLRHTTQLERHD